MFQTIRKLYRPYRNFTDNTETFLKIQKLSRQSGHFPDHLKAFQKHQGFSHHVPVIIKSNKYVLRKNFPDVQKLSGEQWSRAPYVFLSLGGIRLGIQKITFSRALILDHFWAKISKSETTSLSVVLSKGFFINHFVPRPLLLREIKSLNSSTWEGMRYGRRNLKTKSAQGAQSLKIEWIRRGSPIYNRHSTDKLHHFVKKKYIL